MFFPKDRVLWTPQHIHEEWDQMDKACSNSIPTAPIPIQMLIEVTPLKKKSMKQKPAIGAHGIEVVEVEEKSKRSIEGDEPLIL